MVYTIVDDKIRTPEGCELNIVHHCNLTCRSCSHLSPIMNKYLANIDIIFQDFSKLAKYYSPQFIKLLGGEPLLHPGLLDIIDAIRDSGICSRILVCTNGVLLSKMSQQFWEKVDEIEVSVYPGKEINNTNLALIHENAKNHDVSLNLYYYEYFRESYSEVGTNDSSLVHRIYTTCQVAHVWRCHTVFDGHFFKCPQSIFIPRLMSSDLKEVFGDGLEIVDSPDFRGKLLAYLESTKPLSSCYHCLGSVGNRFTHEQQERKIWRMQQQRPLEDLLDVSRLTTLEHDPLVNDGCVGHRQINAASKGSQ